MRLGGNFSLRIGGYVNANIHKILNGAYVAYQNGDEVGEIIFSTSFKTASYRRMNEAKRR